MLWHAACDSGKIGPAVEEHSERARNQQLEGGRGTGGGTGDGDDRMQYGRNIKMVGSLTPHPPLTPARRRERAGG